MGAAATSGAVPPFSWDMVTGLIPGSIGETSVIAIAQVHPVAGNGYRKLEDDVLRIRGRCVYGWVFNVIGPDTPMAQMPWYEHLKRVVSASVPYLWLPTL